MSLWKYLSLSFFSAIIFGGSFIFWFDQFNSNPQRYAAQLFPISTPELQAPELAIHKTEEKEPQEEEIVLLFVGDIMLDRGVEAYMKKNEDWKWPFLLIAETLQEADILFGNLESQISDKGLNVGSIYSFRADPKAMEGLVFAGFDVVSVSNNHSLDYGRKAFEDSLSRLKKVGIEYAGGGFTQTEARSPVVKRINDTTIGFLAYTNLVPSSWQGSEKQSGIAITVQNALEELKKDIRSAKTQAQIIVVSLHAGNEYKTEPTEFQKMFAKTAIDEGAQLVIQHHSHVVQPVERYKNGWIAYGLGNFIFDQGFSEETMEGLLLEVIVKNKQVLSVRPLPTQINNSFQVLLRNQNEFNEIP